MSQFVETNTKTFTAGAAIAQYLRVKIASGVLAVAGVGASDAGLEIGTMEYASFASGEKVAVRLRNSKGTTKMVAAGAYAAGAVVYGAADGEISTTSSGAALGVLMEASTADGDVVEVLRF